MTQPLPVVILARDFFTLQEERVRQYATLSASHREYLNSAPSYDILTYQKAVADATKNFKEISERIIEMRRQLDEEFREKELSNFIAKIQLLEEQNLRLTVDHQLASQQALDDPDDELLERNAKGIKKKLTEIAQEISESIEEMRYRVDEILENQPNASEHGSPEK